MRYCVGILAGTGERPRRRDHVTCTYPSRRNTRRPTDGIGVTPIALSRQLAVSPNHITRIIQGKRAITGDTALRLGHWFQMSARFWLNLQMAYDLDQAAARVGPEIEKLPTRPAIVEDATHVDDVVPP